MSSGTGDRPDNPGPVPVVLGVIGRVDVILGLRSGRGEGHVPFGAAGPDPAGSAGGGVAVPGVARPVGRTDVQVIADAYRAMDERRAIKSLVRIGAI